MKEIAMFFPPLMMILLGVAIGMYISSQLKYSIRRNIYKNNLKEYEKKETKQQKSKIYGQNPAKGKRNKREKTTLHYKTWV